MKWLITFRKDADFNELKKQLRQWHCDFPEKVVTTPLGQSEIVFEVEGPQNLPQLVSTSVIKLGVYPSSKVEPFAN